MDIKEIFENYVKIEPKVIAIESLFNNPDRVDHTNYEPWYQRNYVWDDEKATYFIESILLGTEIPPLIYFKSGTNMEVIDGRQRYQTILRFVKNELKLRKKGLQKLENIGIANKTFKDLGNLRDVFWETKLRIIEFSFNRKNLVDEEMEETLKKEIFKRYNSGITPLKPTDIDKAAYYDDDLNAYIKNKLEKDIVLNDNVNSLFYFEKSNQEVLLKKIRQLLVQHEIPIKYYSIKKDSIISKYYEYLFSNLQELNTEEIYNGFIEKINLLNKIKKNFISKNFEHNRLIFECLFWAFSIIESEGNALKSIDDAVIDKLVNYINNHIEIFKIDRSSFSKEIYIRYNTTLKFFEEMYNSDYNIYLITGAEFKKKTKEISHNKKETTSFDELRINKPEPSSIAIVDITRQMERQRFLIRPPYQRNEVINKKKSSAIIESILLGIKLPPIFIFKRQDGISEVLDGQQRLLSILGFIEKPYLDENNKMKRSEKDGYSLNLKDGIFKNLNSKKFKNLSDDEKNSILNFDLWTIEILQKNNINFEQIDLFIRLNNKPYPIKENTFEMWNSYISRDIIETLKEIHKRNMAWFYFRKNNARMEDENIYTSLSYLQYLLDTDHDFYSKSKGLDIYKVSDKINFRIKSKNEISKILENSEYKNRFIEACEKIENGFIANIKQIVTDKYSSTISSINKNLDDIFDVENGRRTQQSFYALWYFLSKLNPDLIEENKASIREDLKQLFISMQKVDSKSHFDEKVQNFWGKYQ